MILLMFPLNALSYLAVLQLKISLLEIMSEDSVNGRAVPHCKFETAHLLTVPAARFHPDTDHYV